jgi:hypothetical protein
MTISVKNKRYANMQHPWEVLVARPSIFGNPFEIGKDGDRKEVIAKYQPWFAHQVETSKPFNDALDNLVELGIKHGALALYCWCFPADCHAWTVGAEVDARIKKRLGQNG